MKWVLRVLVVLAVVVLGFALFYGSPLQILHAAVNVVWSILLLIFWDWGEW